MAEMSSETALPQAVLEAIESEVNSFVRHLNDVELIAFGVWCAKRALEERAQAPAPRLDAVSVYVMPCPRCGESHEIDVWPLKSPAAMNVRVYGYAEPLPVATWTHWGMCPTFNEPIFHGQQPQYGMEGITVETALPAPPSTGAATGDPRP